MHFKENMNHEHGFIGLSHVLFSWGPTGRVLRCWWLYPLKSLLLDTGRRGAGDLLLDEILRVERGRQGQGMIVYGSECELQNNKIPLFQELWLVLTHAAVQVCHLQEEEQSF